MFFGELGGAACGRSAGLLWRSLGDGRTGEELNGKWRGVNLAERGFEDAVGFGVEDDREHGLRERSLDRKSVAGEGPGGVFELLGRGGLALGIQQGADNRGLKV